MRFSILPHREAAPDIFSVTPPRLRYPKRHVPYNYHAIDTFSFALNSVGPTTAAYTFTASGGNVSGGTQSFTGTISMLTGGITQADIYNNNGG